MSFLRPIVRTKALMGVALIGITCCTLAAWMAAKAATKRAERHAELNLKDVVNAHRVVWELRSYFGAKSAAEALREGNSARAIENLESTMDASVCILWFKLDSLEEKHRSMPLLVLNDAKRYRASSSRNGRQSELTSEDAKQLRMKADDILSKLEVPASGVK